MLGFVLHHFSLTSSLLYSPKESSLELTVWVPVVQVLILLFLLFEIFLSRRLVTVIVVVEEEGVFFDMDEKFEIIEFSHF